MFSSGPQSTLDPAGTGAARLAELFWWLSGGAIAIWIGMIVLSLYAFYLTRGNKGARWEGVLIVGGGLVFPTVVLAGVLGYGLAMIPPLLEPAPKGSPRIVVVGEQYWWRVRYLLPDGRSIELANELRLPRGSSIELQLESRDVIHAFWVPALAGKVDMIPGRQNRLTLEPTKTGVFRGACAEYCGTSHALMSFWVVVLEPNEYEQWLEKEAQDARAPKDPLAREGGELFVAHGCGACHTIRGTSADGVIGPDLTHAGGRLTVGAGILARDPAHFRRWIASTGDVKPGVQMPSFHMLPERDLDALATYLEGLK